MTFQTASTIGSWAIAIARAIDSYALDSKALCRQAGIDLAAASAPDTRYTINKTSRLIRLATEASGDPCFGLTIARFIRPPSWHALGYAIWASATLREAYERLARYFKLFTTWGQLELQETEAHFIIQVQVHSAYQPLLTDEELDAVMATIVLTSRHIHSPDCHPIRVELARPQPADPSGFLRLFKCPVGFAAPTPLIYFDRAIIDEPLPTANPELALRNDQITAEYIARLDRQDIIGQVYSRLIEELPKGEPAQEKIAHAMNMSLRSLQRKLQQLDTSYKQLLDQARHDLAVQYLQLPHLSIGEISYLLGFANIGNFSRAFKRWTGQSPQQYRMARRRGQEPAH